MYTCANCTVLACANNAPEKMPKNCPMRNASVMEAARAGYDLPENHDFYVNCSAIEGLGYCQWPRLKETVEFCKRMGYHKLGLAFCKGLRKEARIVADLLRAQGFEVVSVICKTGELQILGVHNYENVMAAVAMAAAYGVDLDVIRKSVLAFKGVEHRIEYVAEKNGVVYYNDSKGTNPDAAIKGIQAMNRPTILIGGGYDKQSDFHEWIQSFDGKVRYLVLIGATKEQIQKEAAECGFHDCILKDTFEEALDTCVELARPGDAVLLSPACASWGMFPNYEVRGEEFKKYVNAL